MTLSELIERLESADQSTTLRHGFGTPHCDRGDYADLAFEPAACVTVAWMLANARSALGKTFSGYKGGYYLMSSHTDVLIGSWGSCGEEISGLLLDYMLADRVDEPAAALTETAEVRWLPIETAPRDGTRVLVWFRQHGPVSVTWGVPEWRDDHDDDSFIWCVDDFKFGNRPVRGYNDGDDTHWMPLPEPPASPPTALDAQEEK